MNLRGTTLALAALAAICVIQGASAHTYFRADLKPYGGAKESQPEASAVFDGLTHAGEFIWTFNTTGVANMTAAKLVFGNPEIYGETFAVFLNATATTGQAVDGDADFEGIFDATDFAAEYNVTMNGLMAHAGLGHLWVVAVNEVSLPAYKNGILAGPLQFYKPEGEH